MSTRLPRVLVVDNEPRSLDLIRASLQQRGFVALEVCDGDEALLARARGPEYRRETHYVHLYVAYLRQKIEPDLANPRYILTKRGLGYSFRALAAAGQRERAALSFRGSANARRGAGASTPAQRALGLAYRLDVHLDPDLISDQEAARLERRVPSAGRPRRRPTASAASRRSLTTSRSGCPERPSAPTPRSRRRRRAPWSGTPSSRPSAST